MPTPIPSKVVPTDIPPIAIEPPKVAARFPGNCARRRTSLLVEADVPLVVHFDSGAMRANCRSTRYAKSLPTDHARFADCWQIRRAD
jgi:hypothetical protein